MSGRAWILCLTACLGACSRLPESYPPPEQRSLLLEDRAYRLNRVFTMNEINPSTKSVRDIRPELFSTWRWALERPAIDVYMRANTGVRYVMDFAIPGVTFEQTGPVTLTFSVNGHLLDSVRYTEAGAKHFEKPVPAEWIPVGRESTVSAAIDKMWVSPKDGDRLGFILVRMGLTQQ